MSAGEDWIDDVLRFWFVELRPKDWWSGADEIDKRVRRRFASLLVALSHAPPAAAALTARGHVAAVIVFDQFPRNLHRDRPEAFATDALAHALTVGAIDRGLDAGLSKSERQFLYMPLLHAEEAISQERSVAMFSQLGDAGSLRSAIAHQDTFMRFGRFPTRNAALGRTSTSEELAFLARESRSA